MAIAKDSEVTVIYANYYVELISTKTGEPKEVHARKGGFDLSMVQDSAGNLVPKFPLNHKAINAVKADFTRLLTRPTLGDGTKLYDQGDVVKVDADEWE